MSTLTAVPSLKPHQWDRPGGTAQAPSPPRHSGTPASPWVKRKVIAVNTQYRFKLDALKYPQLQSSSHLGADFVCDDVHEFVVAFFSEGRKKDESGVQQTHYINNNLPSRQGVS